MLCALASADIGREEEASISAKLRGESEMDFAPFFFFFFIRHSRSCATEEGRFSSFFSTPSREKGRRVCFFFSAIKKLAQAGGRTSSRFRRGSKEDRPSRCCDARGGRGRGGDARRSRRRQRSRRSVDVGVDSSKHRQRRRCCCFLLLFNDDNRGSPAPSGSHPRCGGCVVRFRRRREPV